MANAGVCWVACLLVILPSVSAQYADDLRGEYCSTRPDGCCPFRVDGCNVRFLDPPYTAVCYCDEFCNRTHSPDCCPDYASFCAGVPPPIIKEGCTHGGQHYKFGEVIKNNCNECKCGMSPLQPTKMEFLCETDVCIIEPQLVHAINSGHLYPWSASNYSFFWGHKLKHGLVQRLGTLKPDQTVRNLRPIKQAYDPNSLPTHFDAREKWPAQIHPPRDQGWCGASWAFSTADVSGDRLAIESNGREEPTLSVQNLISCNNRGQQGCSGGYLDRAWMYMRRFGVVEEDCYPYESSDGGSLPPCLMPPRAAGSTRQKLPCPNQRRNRRLSDNRRELFRMQPAYRLSSKPEDIMHEIRTHGPVQATVRVSADFFMYNGGIYRKSGLTDGERTGYHSVRILGWGEMLSTKYWLAANSWGTSWGENGLFRIVRGENECEIESFVLAAWARPAQLDYRRFK